MAELSMNLVELLRHKHCLLFQTEFRTFWLTSQLVEMEHSVQEVSEHNPVSITLYGRLWIDPKSPSVSIFVSVVTQDEMAPLCDEI